ncbi:hypothetical protein [Spirillospora sp. NPDC048819]|uniref:hypothetical protein n=1 Tax=Spirillospora sp. NPDC048819 TaxID=3155268 RepID=UPI00341157F3
MQDVAIVGLAIGSATILGTVMATVGGFVAEWRRTRRTSRQERDQRAEREQEVHRRELQASLAEVRLAVIKVSVGTQLVQDMRRTDAARLDNHDLPDRIRRIRDDYPKAEAALLGLWGISRSEETREVVASLLEEVAWAFQYGKSAGGADVDPVEIDRRIKHRVQQLSIAVTTEGSGAQRPDGR